MSNAKSTRNLAKTALTCRHAPPTLLSPEESMSHAGLLVRLVHDAMEPQVPYEELLCDNAAAIEREILINQNRKNAIMSSATRSALAFQLSRRSDEPDVAAIGEADEVARDWVYGPVDVRAKLEKALKEVGIIVAEVSSDAYLERAQILAELTREAGRLESRRSNLQKAYLEIQSLRIMNNARSIGGE